MNWIRQTKRLAIYLRDGLSCVYCGASVEGGTQLTLDHVKPHCKGGSNRESNLVTCCHKCNSSRGARPIKVFAVAVATYVNHNVQAADILAQVKRCTCTPLKPFMAQAKDLIAARGSAAKALAAETR